MKTEQEIRELIQKDVNKVQLHIKELIEGTILTEVWVTISVNNDRDYDSIDLKSSKKVLK